MSSGSTERSSCASGSPTAQTAEQLNLQIGDLQAAGFEIWPTFRTPHVTIAFNGNLDERLAALVRTAHAVRVNPYHEPDDEPER